MTSPSASDTPENPVSANVQDFTGENIVGPIHAEGSAQVTVNQVSYSQLSEVEEERARQRVELDALQIAIAQKYTNLNQLIDTPALTLGNPYLFLQPFGFADHVRFFGREDEIAELCERLTHKPITFLSGNSGTGKTSLLKAGLTPMLLKQQHMPLVVNVGSEPLETRIKKEVLPNVAQMPFLRDIALTEFIRMVTSTLPAGKTLFVVVDNFEDFFNDQQHSEAERNDFYNEWQRCFNGAAVNAHWLFSVPSNLQYLLNYFKREVQPNPNTITIPPFDREAAQVAILKPAESRRIQVEDQVLESILEILGGTNIDPASLQLVCYMLAGGNGALRREWTMEYYVSQGKADGILRDYLDRTIAELEPREREPAWQVLSVLADPSIQTSTEEQLVEKLKLYDVEENITYRVLTDLERSNLIERSTAFKLSSDSLRPRIEKWKEMRSARELAREEAIEQLHHIRNSALRGLLGGALGFIAFDQIIYKSSPSFFLYYFFKFLFDAAIGALPGLILVFFVDVVLASYSGQRKWLAYLGGALGGALALSGALVPYSLLIHSGDVAKAILAFLEGGFWGAIVGISIVWVLKSQRPHWITIPICVLLSSLTLIAANSIFRILIHPRLLRESIVLVGVAGAVLPGFILTAAVIGRRKYR